MTLIELLVVIAIFSIIAAIVTPRLVGPPKKEEPRISTAPAPNPPISGHILPVTIDGREYLLISLDGIFPNTKNGIKF
jgi:prepilin-type N-terminal cleavage/methylation domain-containing protein